MNDKLIRDILLVILGGIFGWMLGKLPDRWVHVVIAVAIVLIVIVVKG